MMKTTKDLAAFKTFRITTKGALKIKEGTATDDLFKWRKNIEDGIIDRRQ